MRNYAQFKILAITSMCLLLSSWAWSYDPTAPPGSQPVNVPLDKKIRKNAKQVKKPGFVLRQIVINGEKKSAVINGYIVNEGSYINNALVKAIDKETVKLSLAGKTKVLRLKTRLPKIRR
jgi:predicted acyltransferase (DUF342 family)